MYELDQERIRKMFRAMDELRASDSLVLTWDHEDTLERGGRKIQVKPPPTHKILPREVD